MFLTTVRKFFGSRVTTSRRNARPVSFRPTLESLEGRWVPAAQIVNPGDTIQTAIDAASAGDTIQVNAGTYTQQVVINKDGIKLVASGAVTIQAPGSLTGDGSIIRVTGDADNVVIKGFTVDGNGNVTGAIKAGIRVDNNSSATIRNNTVTGLFSTASTGQGIGILIGDLYANNNRNTAESTGDAKILYNSVTNYDGAGVVVNGTSSSAIIKGNSFTGVGAAADESQYGVQISADAMTWVTWNTVTGNDLASNDFSSAGILVYDNIDKVVAAHNDSHHNDVGAILYGASNGVYTNNHFTSNNGDGISVSSTFGETEHVEASYNQIRHNLVQGNGILSPDSIDNGIGLYSATNNDVKWNNVSGNNGNGIYVFGGSGNEISFSGSNTNYGDGIATGHGIVLEQTTGNTIIFNLITGNAGDGIRLVDADNNTIKYNVILGNGGAGLSVDTDSTGNDIQSNVVLFNEDGNYANPDGIGGQNNTLIANESTAEAAADTLVDDFIPIE